MQERFIYQVGRKDARLKEWKWVSWKLDGIFLIGKLTPHDGSKSVVKEFKPMHCMTEVKRNPEVLLFDIVAKNIIWLVEIPSVVLLIGKEVLNGIMVLVNIS